MFGEGKKVEKELGRGGRQLGQARPEEGITETLRQKQLRVSCQSVVEGVEARRGSAPIDPPIDP